MSDHLKLADNAAMATKLRAIANVLSLLARLSARERVARLGTRVPDENVRVQRRHHAKSLTVGRPISTLLSTLRDGSTSPTRISSACR